MNNNNIKAVEIANYRKKKLFSNLGNNQEVV